MQLSVVLFLIYLKFDSAFWEEVNYLLTIYVWCQNSLQSAPDSVCKNVFEHVGSRRLESQRNGSLVLRGCEGSGISSGPLTAAPLPSAALWAAPGRHPVLWTDLIEEEIVQSEDFLPF